MKVDNLNRRIKYRPLADSSLHDEGTHKGCRYDDYRNNLSTFITDIRL